MLKPKPARWILTIWMYTQAKKNAPIVRVTIKAEHQTRKTMMQDFEKARKLVAKKQLIKARAYDKLNAKVIDEVKK